MNELARRVANEIRWRAILVPGERVLVAVSGGPDSLALLSLLRELIPTFGFHLTVAHFDHGWRADSADDARFVGETARQWGLSLVSHRADGLPHTENAARDARYAFLRAAARDAQGAIIALGHTQDDQAETLMLHLLRGSGARGLRAMRGRADGLARPLLRTSRAEIEAYVKDVGLEPRRDPTNEDPRFLRNRVRREVMPALDAFDPAARRLLARTADILAEEDALLDAEVAELSAKILADPAALRALPVALQRRLLLRVNPGWTFAQVEAARRDRPSAAAHETPTGTLELRARPCECDPKTFLARGAIGHVDADTLALPLRIAHRQPGDRVQPLGFPHHKRLQDLLVDAHIPRHLRDTLPIVRDAKGIVWIPGVTIADPHRVRAETRHQLHLEIEASHRGEKAVTTP